jgi:hypothetical protein
MADLLSLGVFLVLIVAAIAMIIAIAKGATPDE